MNKFLKYLRTSLIAILLFSLVLVFVACQPDKNDSDDSVSSEEASLNFQFDILDNEIVITKYIGTETQVVIPSKIDNIYVTTIGGSSFKHRGSLTRIVIPSTVTSIGQSAFYNCSSLTSINIPSSVTSIGQSAFFNCNSLEMITLPFIGATLNGSINTHFGYIFGADSYTSNNLYVPTSLKTIIISGSSNIAQTAFYNCSGLESIAIPNSLTSIGNNAFYGCIGLQRVDIADLSTWCKISFDGSVANPIHNGADLYLNGTKVTALTIPDGVTSISSYAFYNCSHLTSINIPSSITSIGSNAFYGCNGLQRVDIADLSTWCKISFDGSVANPIHNGADLYLNGIKVTALTIPEGVTSISSYAFYNCSHLTSINIPSSVTSIGQSAFYNCSSLEIIKVPFVGTTTNGTNNTQFGYIFGADSYTKNAQYVPTSLKTVIITGDTNIAQSAFYNCGDLESVTIPNSVTNISSYAFYNCSHLTSINIPSSVTSIGSDAFDGCSGLQRVDITDLSTWCKISFDGSVANPIHNGADLYLNGTKVTALTIPEGVTSISSYAFYNCNSLESIAIPNSVISIGQYAFYNCTGLANVMLENSSQLTSIGNNTFCNCSNLTSITIPSSITSLGNNAFYGCSNLHKVDIADLSTWCKILFDGSASNPMYNGADLYLNGTKVTTLTVPEGVTSISSYAFYNYSGLSSVIIPNSVTTIGQTTFYNCVGIESIVFDNNSRLSSIGNDAFYNCSKLTSISLPSSLTSIGNNSFYGCVMLKSVVCENGSQLETIGRSAFYNCNSLETMTLPFIGASLNDVNNTHFGYIFGADSYTKNAQYVPISLKTVVITGGTNIGRFVFYSCNNLQSITILSNATNIGTQAFYNCSSLKNITIPNSVISIERYAFEDCSELESITLPFVGATFEGENNTHFGYIFGAYGPKKNASYVPASLKTVIITGGSSISDGAFINCSSLESIRIPNSVTSIGYKAFYDCSGLKDIVIPNSVTSIGEYAFAFCSNLKNVTIPSRITNISPYAFYSCTRLESIVIPNNVISIDDYAFNDCIGLESVIFEENSQLTSIGPATFASCSNLKNIVIPISVTNIGYHAFARCGSLELYCETASKPSGWDSSWNYSNHPVYWYSKNEPVLNNDGTAYKGHYWHYVNGVVTKWLYPSVE